MDQDDRREWEESRTRTLALLQDPEASRALVRAIARQDEAYVSTNEILAALCVTVAGMMEEPFSPRGDGHGRSGASGPGVRLILAREAGRASKLLPLTPRPITVSYPHGASPLDPLQRRTDSSSGQEIDAREGVVLAQPGHGDECRWDLGRGSTRALDGAEPQTVDVPPCPRGPSHLALPVPRGQALPLGELPLPPRPGCGRRRRAEGAAYPGGAHARELRPRPGNARRTAPGGSGRGHGQAEVIRESVGATRPRPAAAGDGQEG